MRSDNELLITADGSHTIFSNKLGITYHSKHGAIRESSIVFIESGLKYYHQIYPEKKTISIFEMGFGTGLNALLTYQYASFSGIEIYYDTIEAFPITTELANELNYSSILAINPSVLSGLHKADWNKIHHLYKGFDFIKQEILLENFNPSKLYDIVYFDAFAPQSQAHLWELEMISRVFDILVPGGVLTTFCAKGSFKRTLKSVGFKVEAIPGPPGKREITRALKV
ncbi:MAG: tRNA (5-methylaminomethyl-2-thiouridine)(34)-methyltransferase MnmD [Saprospiraceae bacterium]|nr:tRNA (5-methylaminomethyl-2-thiouridine)(34)-methyltransferase MnmD [Saprospiraceae bacterium]